jgi:glycosyl hydrolase family 106( putative alpha-L-rhamnosidase)
VIRKSKGEGESVSGARNPARTKRAALISIVAILFVLLGFSFELGFAQPRDVSAGVQRELSLAELRQLFQQPPDDSKIMMRWWWFGPAVTTRELEREMRLMKEGGIGGFEVQPVYPLVLDDASRGIKTLPFLSDEFIDALRFTSKKARELGLRLDLTIGSGWPYGGPQVPVAQAASRLRVERVKLGDNRRQVKIPAIGIGEKLIAVFLVPAKEQTGEASGVREITDISDGTVRLPDNIDGSAEVQFYISSRTGQQVKRPAVGAEGFVLDHFDQAAVDGYLKHVGDRLLQAFETQPPYAIFCDSLEVYNADWTGDFLEEFRKRRGYDLKPYLPALVGDLGPQTSAVRRDWGATLTELLNERFLETMHRWSQRNRTLFRIQDYGVPAAVLSSNAYADLPEGEGFQWKTLSATRWASSASHLYGHPVTSSETWTWLHSPVFRATPLDLKAEADLHFLQGINQLIGHGWPYTAEGVEYPGWRFYASGVFNEKNPWWIVMPDVSLYLQRLSLLLRQGYPDNDVAIYLPNDDAWAHFTNGNVSTIDALRERLGSNLIPAVLAAGYNFDFFDDDSLKRVGLVENASLVLGLTRYKTVILPNVERMPVATLAKLAEFAHAGGVVIATRRVPSEAPGLQATPSDHQKVVELCKQLFSGAASDRFVEDESSQLGRLLNGLAPPDVSLSPLVKDIGFIHRRTRDAEVYFLANTSNVAQKTRCTFRIDGMEPEWWDPMTGTSAPAELAATGSGRTAIDLEIEPYGSRVLVFIHQAAPDSRSPSRPSKTKLPPIEIDTDWRVSFGSGLSSTMHTLRSWTDDDSTRFYSGPATYERTFQFPEDLVRKDVRVKLDFGEGTPIDTVDPRARGFRAQVEGPVREAAVISVNGRRAGSVWCPPWSIDITGLLKPGENKLQIVVANTAVNYMAGHSLPDYRLLNLRYGERFQAQDMDKIQPIASGLTGHIRLSIEKE